MQMHPDFMNYIDALRDFISSPNRITLLRWLSMRGDICIHGTGYCHPFGDYASVLKDRGVNCLTGRGNGKIDSNLASARCPLYNDMNYSCKLWVMQDETTRYPHEQAVSAALVLALEYWAAYQIRFPGL